MCATAKIWEACWHVSRSELHARSREVSRVTEVWICAIQFNVNSPLTSQLHALTSHELTWREDSLSPALVDYVSCPLVSCVHMRDDWATSWKTWRSNTVTDKRSSPFQNIQTISDVQLASHSMVMLGFPRGQYGQDVMLTPHFHLTPKLKITGAIPPFRGPL